jgi:hypothetical protein
MDELGQLKKIRDFLPPLSELQDVDKVKDFFHNIRKDLGMELLSHAAWNNNPFAALIHIMLLSIEGLMGRYRYDLEEYKEALEKTGEEYTRFGNFLEALPEDQLNSAMKNDLFDHLSDLMSPLMSLYLVSNYYESDVDSVKIALKQLTTYLLNEEKKEPVKKNITELRALALAIVEKYPEIFRDDSLIKVFWNSGVKENQRALEAILNEIFNQRGRVPQT